MTLAPGSVKALQFFLLDAAKRYARPSGAGLGVAADLLSSAAALDYVLLLASERPGEMLDSRSAVADGVRETMTRATLAALAFIRTMLSAPETDFDDFIERHIERECIFKTFRTLSQGGALTPGDIDFALLTTASDMRDRTSR